MADVLQRLEYDKGVDASRFTFYFREAQLPVKVGAAWGDANDRVNGTERMLAKAIPQHRIAFVSYGQRLVWHRGRRVGPQPHNRRLRRRAPPALRSSSRRPRQHTHLRRASRAEELDHSSMAMVRRKIKRSGTIIVNLISCRTRSRQHVDHHCIPLLSRIEQWSAAGFVAGISLGPPRLGSFPS